MPKNENSAPTANEDPAGISARSRWRYADGSTTRTPVASSDDVAIEAPLGITLSWTWNGVPQTRAVSVTMRTPGHDVELALGFLFGESIIQSANDVLATRPCGDHDNSINVQLRDGVQPGGAIDDRNFFMTSSCGVCGKSSVERVWDAVGEHRPLAADIEPATIVTMLADADAEQTAFQRTGGVHATSVFCPDGGLIVSREDVGRHNAMDKAIGALLALPPRPDEPLSVVLSGRVSFELVQKAARAGIGTLIARGAPSSLAIDMAERFDMLLVGFAKPESFNIYSGRHHVRQAT